MENIYTYHFTTPVGTLELRSTDEHLTHVLFSHYCETAGETDMLSEVIRYYTRQLDDYFYFGRKDFDTRFIQPSGTEFQKKVWTELLKIPFGKTISYLDLAHRLGDPKKVRAVGHANSVNPISIIIPCHRVIGSDGKLVGYGGGLEVKRWLLVHEGDLLL